MLKCSVSLSLCHNDGHLSVKCVEVIVHLAVVGPRVFLTYRFLPRYALTLSLARGTLIFDDIPQGNSPLNVIAVVFDALQSVVELQVKNLMDWDKLIESNAIVQVSKEDVDSPPHHVDHICRPQRGHYPQWEPPNEAPSGMYPEMGRMLGALASLN